MTEQKASPLTMHEFVIRPEMLSPGGLLQPDNTVPVISEITNLCKEINPNEGLAIDFEAVRVVSVEAANALSDFFYRYRGGVLSAHSGGSTRFYLSLRGLNVEDARNAVDHAVRRRQMVIPAPRDNEEMGPEELLRYQTVGQWEMLARTAFVFAVVWTSPVPLRPQEIRDRAKDDLGCTRKERLLSEDMSALFRTQQLIARLHGQRYCRVR